MASKPKPAAGTTRPSGAPAADAPAPKGPSRAGAAFTIWRDYLTLPALALGGLMLAGGVWLWPRPDKGPDFEGALHGIGELVSLGEYDRAIEALNGPIIVLGDGATGAPAQRALFHALRADAVYLAQRARGIEAPENHRTVLHELEQAEHADAGVIDVTRRARRAETLLALGRMSEAASVVGSLAENAPGERWRLTKRLIESRMASPKPDFEAIAGELEKWKHDPARPKSDDLWIVARQNEIRLAMNSPAALIDEVIREIQRQPDQTIPQVGELYLLLGRAHLDLGELDSAWTNLSQAAAILPESDALNGRAELLLARISQTRGQADDARERFAAVLERYPSTGLIGPAMLGLAEAEADLGHDEESITAYDRLAGMLASGEAVGDVSAAEVELSIDQRFQRVFGEGRADAALRLAEAALKLQPDARAPAEAVRRGAIAHLALANEALERAGQPDTNAITDPVTKREARRHFSLAAQLFNRHARLMGAVSPQAASTSMWSAAEAADRAGDQAAAISHFTALASGQAEDSRRLEARMRLARAFQSRGEWKTAAGLYEEVIRDGAGSTEDLNSRVPLAQCYAAVGDEASLKRADEVLADVVNGRLVDPESPIFHEALVQLGGMHRAAGRLPEAIARLDEALQRRPEGPGSTKLMFDLADSLRLSAAEIEREMGEAMPHARRLQIDALRRERLTQARELYERVRAAIEPNPAEERPPLESAMLRSAIFFRADCAYDLGEYELAIRSYDAAAQRYAEEPASLVAMVQIVNAYAALGRWAEARTAHDRARARLAVLSEDAWKSADAPMDRRHWERWLAASGRIEQSRAEAGSSPQAEAPPG